MTLLERMHRSRSSPVETSRVKLGELKSDWSKLRLSVKKSVRAPNSTDDLLIPWIASREEVIHDRKAQEKAAMIIVKAFPETVPDTVIGVGNRGSSFANYVRIAFKPRGDEDHISYELLQELPHSIQGNSVPKGFSQVEVEVYKGPYYLIPPIPQPSIERNAKVFIVDDVCKTGTLPVAVIKELQRRGIEVVGYGAYVSEDWKGGMHKITELTGVPSFAAIRVKELKADGAKLTRRGVANTRFEIGR